MHRYLPHSFRLLFKRHKIDSKLQTVINKFDGRLTNVSLKNSISSIVPSALIANKIICHWTLH